MYPTFPDVLRGVQQTLMRDIMPDLRTDYAREQVGGLLLLLQHLVDRWDRALRSLQEENTDLRRTLGDVAAARGPDAREDDGTKRARANHEAARAGDTLITENRELRARLAAVIGAAAEDSEALARVEAFVARQLARERAAVANTAPTWD